MWPKCCPSSRSATWDQNHFTHLYFVAGCRPARFAVRGWPIVHIPFFLFCFFFSSKNGFERVVLLGQLVFPHASLHQWDISGTWGVPEYSWRAGTHFSLLNTPSLPASLRHTHTHTHTQTQSSHKIMHAQEVQGLVPYQQAHTHLTPHWSHAYQKRMLITYNSRTRARTHTHTPTHPHIYTAISLHTTHLTWLLPYRCNKHLNNIS